MSAIQPTPPSSPLHAAGTAAAHELAATLARLGLEPPASEVLCVARLEDRRLRIVISITEIKADESKLILNEMGRRVLGIQGDEPLGCSPLGAQSENQDETQKTPSKTPGLSPPGHRRVHREILRVAPDKVPLTVKGLAKAARYKYSSYFREAVAELLQSGDLVRICGGVVRAPDKTDKVP